MPSDTTFLIVAGEASGDRHAARLVAEVRKLLPTADFFGAAGPLMRAEGVEAVVEADKLSVVGLAEIAGALPMFLRARTSLLRAARERRPSAAILVDFPDFNLRLAKALKKEGIAVIYYISPQLWAWREYRIGTIRKYVDLLLTILPFEERWYAERGVAGVEYVGSPLARETHRVRTRREFCDAHGLEHKRPIISLLPGSRHKEIVRILPVMLDAAEQIRAGRPDVQFAIAAASTHAAEEIGAIVGERRSAYPLIRDETHDLVAASDAAAVTSGTATLEAAMLGTPMVIVYKTSTLNYTLLRPLISVEHFGLINLIAGKRIARELIQGEMTGGALSDELTRLLEPNTNAAFRAELADAVELLGHGGASRRAAEAVVRMVG